MQSRHTFTGASYHSSTLAGDLFSAAGLSDLENRLVRRDARLLNGVDVVVEVGQTGEQGLVGGLLVLLVDRNKSFDPIAPRERSPGSPTWPQPWRAAPHDRAGNRLGHRVHWCCPGRWPRSTLPRSAADRRPDPRLPSGAAPRASLVCLFLLVGVGDGAPHGARGRAHCGTDHRSAKVTPHQQTENRPAGCPSAGPAAGATFGGTSGCARQGDHEGKTRQFLSSVHTEILPMNDSLCNERMVP